MEKGNLVLILGDQLTETISSLRAADRTRDRVLMVEVVEEATYVRHHKKKIAFLFSAMRHFAESLRQAGWNVGYVTLDAPENTGSFTGEIARAVERTSTAKLLVTEPGEWRVRAAMDDWGQLLGIPVEILDDDRFICSRDAFAKWADGAQAASHGILLSGDAARDRASHGWRSACGRAVEF